MVSIVLLLAACARSAALLVVGVLARDVPRLRAFPKGPDSSGIRRWFLSDLGDFMSANARSVYADRGVRWLSKSREDRLADIETL
jgi:hypothetical protein